MTGRPSSQELAVSEAIQMCSAPSSAFSAGEWCYAANVLAARLQAAEQALDQACTNLAVVRPDLSRADTSIAFQSALWHDALLSGWGGPLGFDPGRRAALAEHGSPEEARP